ncbi:hypothetical protein AB6809_27930 [Paraburkholderia sp. RCC_158]|uniref:hypothetical protein n=1 Tax=Paraburkholderia sp. RCC_158 TaxID=3239220 RepID=UPI0035231273
MKTAAKHLLGTVFVALLWILSDVALADSVAAQTFSLDPRVEKIAEAYASDAVDFSAKHFATKLDWSDASIADVEKILGQMNLSYANTAPKPTDDKVMAFAKVFGSYVGEVYRRNHGGEWGIVTLGGERYPGMQTASGTDFWPWGRAFDRITKGHEDDIAAYYSALLKK